MEEVRPLGLRYARRAVRDLAETFDCLEARSPSGASKVTRRIRMAAGKLAKLPGIGTPTEFPGVRRLPIVRCPYAIFYRIAADGAEVVILHVRHTSRRSARAADVA